MKLTNEVLLLSKKLIETSLLISHESITNEDVWQKRIENYFNALISLESMLTTHIQDFKPPPSQLLIFIGGILGNNFTTKIFEKIQSIADKILDKVCEICNVNSPRELLLLQPIRSSQPNSPNIATQMCRIVVAGLARSSNDSNEDSLAFNPLLRDSLIWTTYILDYPELAGDVFIPIIQPLGIRLTEDYRTHVQIAGLRLLRELCSKTNIADWRYSNRAVAVLSQLLEYRIDNNNDSEPLNEIYCTLLAFIHLLDLEASDLWYEKVITRILNDLLMETHRSRQNIILLYVLRLIKIMKTSFVAHSRQFTSLIPIILLGPRTPLNLHNSRFSVYLDYSGFWLMLNCIQLYAMYAWPLITNRLFPELIAPLITFLDMETNVKLPRTSDHHHQWESIITQERDRVVRMARLTLQTLVKLLPKSKMELLQPLYAHVPILKEFIL